MGEGLQSLIRERLKSEGLLQKPWSAVRPAPPARAKKRSAPRSRERKTRSKPESRKTKAFGVGAYLTSLTVEGFRGIGPTQTLSIPPAPVSPSSSAATDPGNPVCRSARSAAHRRQQALVGSLEDLEGRLAQPTSAGSGHDRSGPAARRRRAAEGRCAWEEGDELEDTEGRRPAERQAEDDARCAWLEPRARVVSTLPLLQRARLDAR